MVCESRGALHKSGLCFQKEAKTGNAMFNSSWFWANSSDCGEIDVCCLGMDMKWHTEGPRAHGEAGELAQRPGGEERPGRAPRRNRTLGGGGAPESKTK